MTYLQFLILFLLPCVVLSAATLFLGMRGITSDAPFTVRRALVCLSGVVLLAVVYTTPWDSWLIRTGVWSYPEKSVLATVFGVPIEEYLFMVGLTALTACWTLSLTLGRRPGASRIFVPSAALRRRSAAFWLGLAVAGLVTAVLRTDALYLGSTLAWYGIPLAVQTWFGADILRAERTLRLIGLALVPLLWIADAVAISAGAWNIGSTHTTGFKIGSLPVEEAVFFFLVSLLVVNSVVFLTHPEATARARFSRPPVETVNRC